MSKAPHRTLFVGLATVVALGAAAAGRCHDLGTYGETFQIAEPDLLKVISGKLHAAESAGKLDQMNEQMTAVAKKHIEHPQAVAGITTTREPKTFVYDPSFTVDHDIADNQGRVFAHAGDRINPLERMPTFNKVMVFIDGDDRDQVKLALASRRQYGADRTRIILTSGAPIDLMRANRFEIDFDQSGYITTKLGITHVPAIVQRAGDKLKIEEVLP